MPPGLKKKLGPLEVWQWAAIGGAIGLILYLRSRGKSEETPATGELFGGTGTGAFGPIDPETGVPYAFEGGGAGGGTTAPGTGEESLDKFLERVGMLQELFPHEREPGTETETVIEKTGNQAQADKAKNARDTGKHPATSTGAGAAAGGASHHSAPHPGTRAIGVGGAKAVSGKSAGKQQGGGSQGQTKVQTHQKQHHVSGGHKAGGGGGGKRRRR